MNTCTCPPPGGSMSCPDDYTAICRIAQGQAHGECVPPDVSASEIANTLRVLERVTRIRRARRRDGTFVEELTPEDRRILDAGFYVSPDREMVVAFRLPRAASGSGPQFSAG